MKMSTGVAISPCRLVSYSNTLRVTSFEENPSDSWLLSLWHVLLPLGIFRNMVMELLRHMNPDQVASRSFYSLKRRTYRLVTVISLSKSITENICTQCIVASALVVTGGQGYSSYMVPVCFREFYSVIMYSWVLTMISELYWQSQHDNNIFFSIYQQPWC